MSITDVTNPGLIIVADEAYPPPLPSRARLPQNLGVLIAVADEAALAVPNGVASGPAEVEVDVASQNFILPSFNSGASAPTPADVNVDSTPLGIAASTEYVVTEAGNFPTNGPGLTQTVNATISAIVDADTGGAVGGGTTRYKITLSASLVPYGISFLGREVKVVASVTAGNVNQTRTISYWSVNVIYISKSETDPDTNVTQTFGTDLAVGATLQFNVVRDGFEAVSTQLGQTSNVVLAGLPPLGVPEEVDFDNQGPVRNVFVAQSIRGLYFFEGSGVAAPPFQGDSNVATQTFGLGLPANVFV
jgi:hypothetical protein